MSEISGYDVVGDIGGNLSAFNKLTQKLGYEKVSGHLRHPDARILVSVGDIVNGGDANRPIYDLLRATCEEGLAQMVPGNQEFMHLQFALDQQDKVDTLGKKVKYLQSTLDEFSNDQTAYREMVKWFASLPITLKFNDAGFRIAHACYDEIGNKITSSWRDEGGALSDDAIRLYARDMGDTTDPSLLKQQKDLRQSVDKIIYGHELALPQDYAMRFGEKGGERKVVRPYYWRRDLARMFPSGKLFKGDENVDIINDQEDLNDFKAALFGEYNVTTLEFAAEKMPTLVGHFSLSGSPRINQHNLVCLDYKEYMTAYRVDMDAPKNEDGHHKFNRDNLVSVSL